MRVQPKVYVVVNSDGEHFMLEKEPNEGILTWAKGQFVTVFEYGSPAVVYEKHPPVKSEPAPPAASPVSQL